MKILLAAAAALVLMATPAYADTMDVEIEGLGITLHEDSADPLKAVALQAGGRNYLRDGDTFAVQRSYYEMVPAPKGGRVAARLQRLFGGHDAVVVTGPGENDRVTIPTVRSPREAGVISWSRDGRKIVTTSFHRVGKKWFPDGFVTIDVARRKAKAVKISGLTKYTVFQWSPDGRYVVGDYTRGMRFYRPDGKIARTFKDVGWRIGGEDTFSPSGKRLATWCPSGYSETYCLWDTATGKLRKRVDASVKEGWGWWDDDHLLAVQKKSGGYQVVALDLKGKATQVVADITSASWKKNHPYLIYK
ncbi:MAG: WD40 repeat domain-containing protein [Nonomuraea sp.]|nr:WD40 repeat domain-containing protein [Nonomuraea sp.]